jgi:hypothetical protein
VVDDAAKTDKVFKYSLAGSLLGSWTIDAANKAPTGITIDPTNVNQIWIVDSGTDRVYQYNGAATRISGSQSASLTFALAAGNTNPQGIADPPPPSSLSTVAVAATSDSSLIAPGGTSKHPATAKNSSAPADGDSKALFAASVDQILADSQTTWTRKSLVKLRL